MSDGQRLQSMIHKAVKQGFLSPAQVPLTELCQQADETLFSGIVCVTYTIVYICAGIEVDVRAVVHGNPQSFAVQEMVHS